MNLNPNLAAVLIALCFGVVIFPWAKATSKLGIGEFFAILGIVYLAAGTLQCLLRKNALYFSANGIWWSLLTATIYVLALSGVSYFLPRPETNLRVFVAITAAYPAVTTILSAANSWRLPPLRELFFISMTIIGVAGLSFFGENQSH